MKQLSDCKNIGPTILNNINSVGIQTLGDLKAVRPEGVYKRLREKFPNKHWPVCYYLYSLEGALTDQHWDDIGERRKEALLAAVETSE